MEEVSVNFIELIALTRITPESTMEKFGSLINSSFFDSSNILAGLKMKGLVDFVTAFPSQSTLKLTEEGAGLISDANKKAIEPLDPLDLAILAQLAASKKNLPELGAALNVAQKDLALHLYKLSMQQNISYELVNATVSLSLTEKGFVTAKGVDQNIGQPSTQTSQQNGASPQAGQTQEVPQSAAPQGAVDEIRILEGIAKRRRQGRKIMFMAIGVIVIVVIILLLLLGIL